MKSDDSFSTLQTATTALESEVATYNHGLTEDEARVNFDDLATQFARYYAQFESHLGQTPFKNSSYAAACYVLLGVSGAGKTTTLARLKSDLTAEEFFKTITDKTGETKEFLNIEFGKEDLTIGHTANCTTVVPRIYTLDNGLHVCDMPGFAEQDPMKKIIIR